MSTSTNKAQCPTIDTLSHHTNKAVFNVRSFQTSFRQLILKPLSHRAKVLRKPSGFKWIEPGSNKPATVEFQKTMISTRRQQLAWPRNVYDEMWRQRGCVETPVVDSINPSRPCFHDASYGDCFLSVIVYARDRTKKRGRWSQLADFLRRKCM